MWVILLIDLDRIACVIEPYFEGLPKQMWSVAALKSYRTWLNAFMIDIDTWPHNSVKILILIWDLHVKHMQLIRKNVQFKDLSTITFRLIKLHSLNKNSNCKILLLCINLWICSNVALYAFSFLECGGIFIYPAQP